jgi:hypothetical protein
MDLTRLYNLTTPELRVEAERLGVRDTYAMSRGQLIYAIRSRSAEAQPEGLLGKVLGFAKWAIQTTAAVAPKPEDDTPRPRRQSEVPMPSVGPRAPASETSPSVPDAPSASTADTLPATEPASELASPPAPDRRSALEFVSMTGPASSPPARSIEEDQDVVGSSSSSHPPAGVFSGGISSFEEPFPTRTMARILADQGHFRRSLAIYAKLLQEHPSDPELGAEAEEVRSRSRARRSELQ